MRITFDQNFQNGPPRGILSLNQEKRNPAQQKRNPKQKKSNRKKKADRTNVTLGDTQPNHTSRSITNLMMTLVLIAFTLCKGNNKPNGSQDDNENDSDPEDESVGFNVDGNHDYDDIINGTLNQHNLLHGYIPDNNYNLAEMEDDGVYQEEFTWKI
jgi:hypothetical protein